MLSVPRDHTTIDQLQELLDDVFAARDELYAAADLIEEADRRFICRWFADRLGGHAAFLQQVVAASGVAPVDPRTERGQLNIRAACQSEAGDGAVLDVAARIEHVLNERYAVAINCLADQQVASLLAEQREELEFADCVLRSVNKMPK